MIREYYRDRYELHAPYHAPEVNIEKVKPSKHRGQRKPVYTGDFHKPKEVDPFEKFKGKRFAN